ncbi:unnamed protein product [Bemisia tabaci]|uniref:1-Cys peroxiredoxin n=1 Tax=Bemisia tabaci TaxID=7038 RepID=A0A9P0AJ89_BEMTA|nr:PREDICTED: peroxiredoxin-6 [Bemisia tabaci]XP_018904899.1 PREDICTED: peroxiredoxin-6 [Bemisia tabaci]XP_018904900.1 PREDICTED: peroxiredoxin-6 [Bemisia tabaci]XP_018904901.1 PREDICTED: peroxiredoxin-6 [Bemisia tabaci]CAH0392726.1 unnamed protein product [Bemisia tabaci]
MKLGDIFPNFEAETTDGPITFHEWLGDSWGILFSHPADFTPVCTTELARAATLHPEFAKRKVKLIALSCDAVSTHKSWIKDIKAYGNLPHEGNFPFPIIDDVSRKLAVDLNMLDPDEKSKDGLPLTCRAVFVIDPRKKLRASILYPASSGRNFDEILRLVDSLQLTDRHQVATPADWKNGFKCVIQPTVSDEDAKNVYNYDFDTYPLPSNKGYLRMVRQPE